MYNKQKNIIMKKIALLFTCLATFAVASCSILQSAASSNTVATTAGQTCGSAILALYNAYKATGKIDLSNPANLANALTLATSYTMLQQNKGNDSFTHAFASGMALGATGLLTPTTATTATNTLANSSALGNINRNNATSSSSSTAVNKFILHVAE